MPRIPIPFIGGGMLSQASKSREEKLPPPFLPDMEVAKAAGQASPAKTEEAGSISEAEGQTPLEVAAEDWGKDIGSGDATALDSLAPSEAAPAVAPEAPETAEPPERSAAEAVEPVFLSPESRAAERDSERADVPDFLVGAGEKQADEAELVEESGSGAPEMPVRVDQQDLQYVLPELLTGESGEQIRDLIEKLKGETVERAIPRAFAAGYLAGRRRQED